MSVDRLPSGTSISGGTAFNLILDDNAASDQDNNGTSFEAMAGLSQVSFTVPISGSHLFIFETAGHFVGATMAPTFRISIDSDDVIVGSSDKWIAFSSSTASIMFFTFVDVVTLSAGSHTADFEIKVSNNTWRRASGVGTARCVVIS